MFGRNEKGQFASKKVETAQPIETKIVEKETIMAKKIVVSNEAEKVLIELELKDQLSDGYWENAKPVEHYKDWMEAEVVVNPTKGAQGANFPMKRHYDFTSYDLLKNVRARMILLVRLAKTFGAEKAKILETLYIDTKDDSTIIFTGIIPESLKERATRGDADATAALDVLHNVLQTRREDLEKCALNVKGNIGASSAYDVKRLMEDLLDLNHIVKLQLAS